MNPKINSIIKHLVAAFLLVIVNIAFFSPQYSGKRLNAGDTVQGVAMRGEIHEFKKKTGETYNWNNSMFMGMPEGMLTLGRDKNLLRHFNKLFRGFQKGIAGQFIMVSLIAYLTFLLFRLSPFLAFLGAILISFNVNYIILTKTGHYNKIQVAAYFPLILGGIHLVLRNSNLKKQFLGAAIFTLGTSLALSANHPQMLYYFLLVSGVWFLVAFFSRKFSSYQLFQFRSLAMLLIGLLLAVLSNLTQVNASLSVSKGTMRGDPILNLDQSIASNSSSTVKGLDWDYATQWSNGVSDIYSLIIPRAVGGSSGEGVDKSTETGKLLRANGAKVNKRGKVAAPMYWGKLPFTAGPYYFGALTFFLFVLAMFVLPLRLRVAFGLTTLLIFLISLGNHFTWFNKALFDYLPFFNKFRAPNSILHATPVFFIFPAILGLHQILSKNAKPKNSVDKKILASLAVSVGVCVLIGLLGQVFFDFTGQSDNRYPSNVQDILISDRKKMLLNDTLRTILIILLSGLTIWAFTKKYINSKLIFFILLAGIAMMDLWSVSRRYFSEENWVKNTRFEQNYQERAVDKEIKKLEPKGRGYYRVQDLSIDTYQSAITSYHHNTIGGYSALKPQRMQDMIDRYLRNPNQQVLNMFNARYLIQRNGGLKVNEQANGSAWIVNKLVGAANPDDEISKIREINTKEAAIINSSEFPGVSCGNGNGEITLVAYSPTKLEYSFQSSSDQLAVFSEAWDPKGWNVEIDGEKAQILRANYLLRALQVPSGSHSIVFMYKPNASFGIITLLCSLVIAVILIFAIYLNREMFESKKNVIEGEEKLDAKKSKPKKKKIRK